MSLSKFNWTYLLYAILTAVPTLSKTNLWTNVDEKFLSAKFGLKLGFQRMKKCSQSDDQEHFLCFMG